MHLHHLIAGFSRRARRGCLAACAGALLIATGAAAEPVTDYELTPRLRAHLPFEPHAAALSTDGTRIATGGGDGTIVIWRTADGRALLRLNGHRDIVTSLAFNTAGERLASTACDGTVRVWSTATGEAISVLESPAARPACMALSPDGTRVAVGGYDGSLKVWYEPGSAADAAATARFAGPLRGLAFAPDGRHIAVGDDAGIVRIVAAADASELLSATQHAGAVRSLVFSPDGTRLLTGGDDGQVRAWNPHTLEELWSRDQASPAHELPVVALSFTHDARLIASADRSGEVRVWDAATRERTSVLAAHRDQIVAVGFLPDAQAVVTVGRDRAINLWTARLPPTPRLARLPDAAGNLWSVSVAPDAATVYAAGRKGVCGAWDLNTGTSQRQYDGFTGTIDAIDLSADGRYLAVCGWREKTALIFETGSGAQAAERAAEADVRCVRFSPDGATLAVAREDGKLQLWAWRDGAGVRLVNVSEQAVYDVAFSPDGRQVVACGGDWRTAEPGFLKLFNRDDLAVAAELGEHQHAVRAAAFNRDGTQLASADEAGRVVIWNMATRLPVMRLNNGVGARPLAWSPDGSRLAVGLHDGAIHVWDAASGELVRRLRSEDDVFGLAFGGDGSVLFSVSGRPRVEVWPVAENSSTIEQIRGWVP